METAAKLFFSSPRFAVAGASQDPHKFGYRVLAWYHARSLNVQPVTPSRPSIKLFLTEYPTVSSPSALPYPQETSLSLVTPPPITLNILREAKEAGIPAVWLQPGSFNDEALRFAKQEFVAGIGGEGGMGSEGWCVLVDGDEALRSARDKEKNERV
ncbi:hypothetical protein MMC29_004677 [Sticta canariensis]|nr:hypothetical protein [Sticta canariensis]